MMRSWIQYALPASWLVVSIWYLTDAAVDLLPTYALMAGTGLMVLAWIVGLVTRISYSPYLSLRLLKDYRR